MKDTRGIGNRAPSLDREFGDLKKRLTRLETALAAKPRFPAIAGSIPFSWSGTVSGTRTSGPWDSPGRITITRCRLGFHVAGGSTTTCELLLDGISVHQFILPAGSTRSVELVRIPVDTYVDVQIYVDGGGGEMFTAIFGYLYEAVAI